MKIVSVKWQDSNVVHGWRPKVDIVNDDVPTHGQGDTNYEQSLHQHRVS